MRVLRGGRRSGRSGRGGDTGFGERERFNVYERLVILHYPEPVLRRKAEAVPFDAAGAADEPIDLAALARRMGELVVERNGVGLAAPQVGKGIRLFVVNMTIEPAKEKVYINPKLTALQGQTEAEEGCLSIPGVNVVIRRAEELVIRARDLKGEEFEEKAEGLIARVWQHEMDHLNGRLILDYMNEESRLINRRAVQQLQEEYEKRTGRPKAGVRSGRRS